MKKLILFLALILGIQTISFAAPTSTHTSDKAEQIVQNVQISSDGKALSTGEYMLSERLKEMDSKLSYMKTTSKIYRIDTYIRWGLAGFCFLVGLIGSIASS